MEITEKRVYSDFVFLKEQARLLFEKGKIEECIENLKLACTFAKTYYLTYMDNDIEDLCESIADLFTTKYESSIQQIKQDSMTSAPIMFYDYFGMDRISLSQQYLRAFGKRPEGLVYLVPHKLRESKSKIVIQDVERQHNTRLIEIESPRRHIQMIESIIEAVIGSSCDTCFIHTATDDIDGVISFYALNQLTRYFIEQVDHTIWLGVRRFNYYICFRSFGYWLATERRGINADKLIIQPYYPILDSSPFEGLPNRRKDEVRLFSGGRLFKTYSKNDKFFHIVRRILEENPNTVFYYAGGGNIAEGGQSAHLRKLIRKYGLENRYYLLGYRKDINYLMSEMDIYIGTWPMPGALMTQNAAAVKLPIVQYSKDGMGKNIEDFLNVNNDVRIVFEDEDNLYSYIQSLVKHPQMRERIGEKLSQGIIEISVFEKNVFEIIEHPQNKRDTKHEKIDIVKWRNYAFEKENHCEHQYYTIYVNSSAFRKHKPISYLVNCTMLLFSTDPKWLREKLKKKALGLIKR